MQTNTPGSLKDKFGSFGAAPTEQLWDSISSSIDQKEKRKRGAFWWWFAGVAASCLLLFGIYQLGYEAGVSEKESVLVDEEIPNYNNKIPNSLESQNEISSDQNVANQNLDEQNHNNFTTVKNDQPHQENKLNHSVNHSHETQTNMVNEDILVGLSPNEKVELRIDQTNSTDYILLDKTTDVDLTSVNKLPGSEIEKITSEIALPDFKKSPELIERKPESQNWEIGFLAGAQTSFNHLDQSLSPIPTNSLTADQNYNESAIPGSGLESFSGVSATTGSISRPLSLSFSIARKVGYRWSVQSGLGINYLKARTTYETFDPKFIDASFFSLSVPLLAEFDFVKRKRLELSTAFGIVNEIPLYTASTTTYGALQQVPVKSHSFVNGYMCSALYNVGVSYHFNEKMKIGFYPNARYYLFQTLKSDAPVLERKLWLGANVGLIWNI